jgi:hypothetical protein
MGIAFLNDERATDVSHHAASSCWPLMKASFKVELPMLNEQNQNPIIETTESAVIVEPVHALAAFRALVQAYLFAKDVALDPWEFAMEFRLLQDLGLSINEVRWLIAKSYTQHAAETTSATDTLRSFGPTGISLITDRSCFVLTENGFEFAKTLFPDLNGQWFTPFGSLSIRLPTLPEQTPTILPVWNCDLREVRYNGLLVKQFKLPSPNQEAILMTFEEEKWPIRIDDPLPCNGNCDPKQRLHDTIRSLNRNQKNKLLRFKGDGTGEGILWEPRLDSNDEAPE